MAKCVRLTCATSWSPAEVSVHVMFFLFKLFVRFPEAIPLCVLFRKKNLGAAEKENLLRRIK